MFTGGYTQQIMRPLNLMICSTLVASLLAALTIVPLMIAKLLAQPKRRKNILERLFSYTDVGIAKLSDFYTWILRKALKHRFITLILALVILVVSMKTVPPLIGKEMMPPMDTGISVISFNTHSDMNLSEVEKVVKQVENIIYQNKYVVQVSTIVGAEPGQISFGGGGRTSQSVQITTRMIPRNKRNVTIWQVDEEWRKAFARISGIRDLMVTEYGATPLSTTKAPLDVIISGSKSEVLSSIADEVIKRLKTIPGLIDIRRSWYKDKTQYRLNPDPLHCAMYGVTPMNMGKEVKATLKGEVVGAFNLEDYLAIPIRVKYADAALDSPEKLEDIYVPSKYGFIQLRNIAKMEKMKVQPYITRENQLNTIDITALNRIYTIGQLAAKAQKKLVNLKLPAGYTLQIAGSMADMKASNVRMVKALLIGLVLLYMLLLAMFKSFVHPVTIMAAIPLAVAGAMWGLLIFDKPMCKPAMMGIIFLGGTIVNNSILLLDFIIQARKKGIEKNEAIINSVKLRIRPILMTTVSTIVGLMPLIFEMAVGLERMSPLGIVAAFGLASGTILTLVVIPVAYSLMDDLSRIVTGKSMKLYGCNSTMIGASKNDDEVSDRT
jgi:multidrug efflux pump subunit AcrB